MGRKMMGATARKVDVRETANIPVREELKLVRDAARDEKLVFTSPSDWTPEQAEQYLDWQIQLLDGDIAKLRQQLDDLTAARKRWLSVTGGRSKIVSNGDGHADDS